MRILFINLPYYGHVVPTIGLVQALIRQGCQVTYMLPFDWEDKLADSGATFYGYANHSSLAQQMKNAWQAAEQIIGEHDFVIYEQFFFSGKHLAEKYQKPVARVFTATATNEVLMQEFIKKGPMSAFCHKWLTKAFTKDVSKGIPLQTDNWLDEIVQNPPALNFVYSLRQYQPYEEEFSKEQYCFLGPSVYDRSEEKLNFVKRNRPLVYISLGSLIKGQGRFFQSCVDAFRGEDVDVILSVGKKFSVDRLKHVPDNVHVYPWVPQMQVLSMADVFVTHAGMNSISEALVTETPMVLIPLVSDQPVNAQSMEKLGVGRILEYGSVNGERLRQVVKEVLSDEAMKKHLEMMKHWIREAPGNEGAAKMIVEYDLRGGTT